MGAHSAALKSVPDNFVSLLLVLACSAGTEAQGTRLVRVKTHGDGGIHSMRQYTMRLKEGQSAINAHTSHFHKLGGGHDKDKKDTPARREGRTCTTKRDDNVGVCDCDED